MTKNNLDFQLIDEADTMIRRVKDYMKTSDNLGQLYSAEFNLSCYKKAYRNNPTEDNMGNLATAIHQARHLTGQV